MNLISFWEHEKPCMHSHLQSNYCSWKKEESNSHLLKLIWLWSNQASTEQAKQLQHQHDHSVCPEPRGETKELQNLVGFSVTQGGSTECVSPVPHSVLCQQWGTARSRLYEAHQFVNWDIGHGAFGSNRWTGRTTRDRLRRSTDQCDPLTLILL